MILDLKQMTSKSLCRSKIWSFSPNNNEKMLSYMVTLLLQNDGCLISLHIFIETSCSSLGHDVGIKFRLLSSCIQFRFIVPSTLVITIIYSTGQCALARKQHTTLRFEDRDNKLIHVNTEWEYWTAYCRITFRGICVEHLCLSWAVYIFLKSILLMSLRVLAFVPATEERCFFQV